MNRTLNRFRGGSRRGGERGDHLQVEPDGWAVAGGPATRPASRAGDLSKFGQHITKLTPAAAALDDAGAESATGGHMSEVEAKTRIEEDTKEFFSIRDLEEAEAVYFTKLPSEFRHLLGTCSSTSWSRRRSSRRRRTRSSSRPRSTARCRRTCARQRRSRMTSHRRRRSEWS